MQQSMRASGLWEPRLDKDRVFRYGPMALCMKAGGRIIRQMEKAD